MTDRPCSEPTLIVMPVRDEISAPTMRCLQQFNDGGGFDVLIERGLPVDEARNRLCERIRALPYRPRYVLWIDSDAVW